VKPLDFLIVGAQKSGTTALAHFLDQHPGICMANPKECHLFDDPDYDGAWSSEEIDRRYQRFFTDCSESALWGEATPAYMFYPDIPAELARYRRDLKLLVLLRDPVDRAISHYRMERTRGHERLPLWLALLAELLLGRNGGQPRAPERAFGRYCYRKRGLYSVQLRRLYRYFPREQVMVINQADLHLHHQATLATVFDFLGAERVADISPEWITPQARERKTLPEHKYRILRHLLRISFHFEYRRLQREHGFRASGWDRKVDS
jgi:hypothetical protein